jgi:tetratricopeptide (TPR) repeat protein
MIMSKSKKNPELNDDDKGTVKAKVSRWNMLESYLERKRRFVLALILSAGLVLRIIYFVQLNNTPSINYHQWDQTDMNFFDKWAKYIGDDHWLQDTSYYNFTYPFRVVSGAYLSNHPEAKNELMKYLPANAPHDSESFGKALFIKWGGEKVYFQEPLYVYVVATIYKIFGPDVRFVFILQFLIGLGSLALLYLITRDNFGNIAALFASVIALLHGPMMFYELILLRESMILFGGLILVYSISRAWKNKTAGSLFMTGIVIGICILLKSIFIIFGFLFIILLLSDHFKKKQIRLTTVLLAIAGILTGMLPLIIRNLIVGISPITVASSGAFSYVTCNFYGYDPAAGFVVPPFLESIFYRSEGKLLPAISECLNTFPSFTDYIALLWQKFKLVFLWVEIPNNKSFYYYRLNAPVLSFTFISFSIIAAISIPGMVLSAFRKKRPIILYLLVITHLAILVGFLVLSRYRIPLTAALIPFAGLALSEIFRRLESNNSRSIALIVPAFALFFLIERPAPKGMLTLRYSDYVVPYEIYYGPKITEAMNAGRSGEALKLMRRFLKTQPEALEKINPGQPAFDPFQLAFAVKYSEIYRIYAAIAEKNDLKEEASRYLQRSNELSAISDKFAPETDMNATLRRARSSADPIAKQALIDKVVTAMQSNISANPKDLASYNTLAIVYLNDLKDSANYEATLKKAIANFPDEPQIKSDLGHYYLSSGKKLPEAESLLEQALKALPSDSRIYADLGYCYAAKNQYGKAREYWTRSVRLNPADCATVNNLRILDNMQK